MIITIPISVRELLDEILILSTLYYQEVECYI